MNAKRPTPPRDEDIDALLARRYHDTTPEFEARWVALKRELRTTSGWRHQRWLEWRGWLAFAGLTAALAGLALGPWRREPLPAIAPPSRATVLADLVAMDAVLAPAAVLLEKENRMALLHLPTPPPAQPQL